MRQLVRAPSSYVEALENAADVRTQADDRPNDMAHLVAAARMFRALQDGSLARLKAIVADEGCSFGKCFLAGDPGMEAEAAFDAFANLIHGSG